LYVIVKVILGFSATIGLVVFVYAGVIILISKGNPDAYKKGTNLIKYTFGGIIIIIFSYAIVSFLTTTIPGVTGGASSGDASGSSVPCTTNSDCTQTDYYCHSWSAPIVCTKVVSGDICDTTGKCYKTDDTVNIGSKTSSPNGFCGGGKISGWGCYK